MARTKTVKENSEYAALMARLLRTYSRRVGNGDLADLADLAQFAKDADRAIGEAVDAMRQQQGYSWTDIGNALGTTRQAAQIRFGRNRAQGAA